MLVRDSAVNANLQLHRFLPRSRANGPGLRAVLWVQGCTLECPGCFNPQTHRINAAATIEVDQLFEQIRSLENEIEGITISGGEPLQQRPAVSALLRRIRTETSLSAILFSGFTWMEISRTGNDTRCSDQSRPGLLRDLDILIAGRYVESQRIAFGLRGSANKTIHFLTDRYTLADLEVVPPGELIIGNDGEIISTGIEPVRF
jgi:anaerobic ribonucleoside-triphosphate reductase activating protein